MDVRTINEHIKKIYSDSELEEDSTIRNFRIVQTEGPRQVTRDTKHYRITGEYATPEGYLIDIVEDQPTEEANEDTVDNESQEDFSEESEEENPESSLENEDYPGEDVVEIINLQGETTTVYKLVDGRYMDCTNTVYIYDGKDTWTDTNGVEWNREVK